MRVVSGEYARRKRPAMYGDPVCALSECCTHAPHEAECDVCKTEKEHEEEQAKIPWPHRGPNGEALY